MKNKRLTVTFTVLSVFALLLTAVLSFTCVNLPQQTAEASASSDWTPTYTGSYYNEIDDSKNGKELRDDLYELIWNNGKTWTSYDGLRDIYHETDGDPNNSQNVIMFYTGSSVKFTGAFGSSAGTVNREHVWPKDGGQAFPATSEAGSDAHHLRPCDAALNSTRGSKNYDELTSGSTVTDNGNSNVCRYNSDFFYPGKGYRGATARIIFYTQLRWGNKYNLKFVDSKGSCKTIGKLSVLLKWNLEEPPTDEEIRRNEVIANSPQGNRNPFIDHPEYAAKIYCHTDGSTDSAGKTVNNLDGTALGNRLVQVVADHGGNYNDSPIDVDSVSFDAANYNLIVGNSLSLTSKVTVLPSNANQNVTFTSSNAAVARIDGSRVVATGAGTATITATSVKDSSKTATATITVKALDRLELSGEPNKKIYNVGDRFDPTGITVKLYYSDGSSDGVANSQCSWLDGVTNAVTLSGGTTAVKCKYGGLEAVVNGITVKYMTGITVSGTPNKTIYEAGDRFAPQGLTVTATFSDGSTSNIDLSACSWVDGVTGSATLSKGTTSVTCKYGSFSATVNGILIKDIDRIAVSGTAQVTKYSAGQHFNPQGLTVTVYFNDGTSQTVDNSACQWLDFANNSATISNGTQTIYCKYGNVSCAADERISIFVKQAVSIRVDGVPAKTEYIYGEKFDFAGLKVYQVFNDGEESLVALGDCKFYDELNNETLALTAKKVVCKFGGFSAEVGAGILVKQIQKIELSGTLQKSAYEEGQTFDPAGLIVVVKFDKGADETVAANQCLWLDNNGSASVTSATVSFSASYTLFGKTYTSDAISVSIVLGQNANDFISKVNLIANASTKEETFSAIKAALSAYAVLTDDEKSDVAPFYATLGEYIVQYNEFSQGQNDCLKDVVLTATVAVSQAAAALLAALYIVGKKSK